MFCSRCGAELPHGAEFCGNCGQQVADGGMGPVSVLLAMQPVPQLQTAPAGRKRRLVAVIAVAAVAVVALAAAAGAGLYFSGPSTGFSGA